MKVEVIKDYHMETCLIKGVVLYDCIISDGYYIGMFESKKGNYVVDIPENYCKVIDLV